MRKLSRRSAILGALVCSAAPSAVHAELDRHQEWLKEWRDLHERYEAFPDDSLDADTDHLYSRMQELIEQAQATPAQTRNGMTAKLELFRESHFGFDGCYVDPTAANAMVDELIAFVGSA